MKKAITRAKAFATGGEGIAELEQDAQISQMVGVEESKRKN